MTHDCYACTECGCLWRKWHHDPLGEMWSLYDDKQKAGKCCDNSPDFLSKLKPVDRHPDIHGVRWVKGRPYARLRLGGRSLSVPLGALGTAGDLLRERRQLIFDQAKRLQAACRLDMESLLLALGEAQDDEAVRAVLGAIDVVCDEARILQPGDTTIRDVGDQWVKGLLAQRYPDHIKIKSSAERDRQLLETYVYPVIGDMPVPAVKLEDCERVMRRIPAENPHSKKRKPMSVAQRRHVAQVMHRLLIMCAYPLQLIKASPLPKGFLPKLTGGKAKAYLYPDEDARLMACAAVPLVYRVFYGVIAREGFRFNEARTLSWNDLDLERGAVKLDRNKTDDARAWALDPGVSRALARWSKTAPPAGPFAEVQDDRQQAERFRKHLMDASVDRPELHEASDERARIRVHDLRATFVTTSLANGMTETWVSDRTGHKSSAMINRYKRAARTLSELGLGKLKPLDEAIAWPEEETAA